MIIPALSENMALNVDICKLTLVLLNKINVSYTLRGGGGAACPGIVVFYPQCEKCVANKSLWACSCVHDVPYSYPLSPTT